MRRRTIDPSFWDSLHRQRLSDSEQLLFLGLISHADDQGRVRGHLRYLLSTIYKYDEKMTAGRLERMLQHLSLNDALEQDATHEGLIGRYEAQGEKWIVVLKFRKWQKIDHPTASRIPTPPETLQARVEQVSREQPKRGKAKDQDRDAEDEATDATDESPTAEAAEPPASKRSGLAFEGGTLRIPQRFFDELVSRAGDFTRNGRFDVLGWLTALDATIQARGEAVPNVYKTVNQAFEREMQRLKFEEGRRGGPSHHATSEGRRQPGSVQGGEAGWRPGGKPAANV